MALPSSPFCVNWSHKANTDEHIQWWDLMRLLWVNSRNAAQRPSGSHTCGKVVCGGGGLLCALVADSQCAAVACSTSGCVAWYKSSGRCHESTHVHTPWNTMSEPGRGRELSHPMLDSHPKLELLFSCRGEDVDVAFSTAKELNLDALSHLHPHQALRPFTHGEYEALLLEIHWAVHAPLQRHKEEPQAKFKMLVFFAE